MRAKIYQRDADNTTDLRWLLAIVLSASIGLPLAFGTLLRLFA